MLNFDIKNLKYVVEWWEDDCLDIDGNQHILFVFQKKKNDILVTKANLGDINKKLSEISKFYGEKIKIELEFNPSFFNRVIYPSKLHGSQYYKPKYNKTINYILKRIGLKTPLRPMIKFKNRITQNIYSITKVKLS